MTSETIEPANPYRRAAAAVVDTVLVWLGYVAAILVGELVPEGDVDEAQVFFPRLAIALTVIAGTFLYFIIPEAKWGRTPGKSLLGLRVVTVDGAPIGLREAVIRNLLRPIDFSWMYTLGAVVALANRRRQRIGDLAAATIVISS